MTENLEPPCVIADGDTVELYQHGVTGDGRCISPAQAEALAIRLLIAARDAQHDPPFDDIATVEDVRLALRNLAIIAARVTGGRVCVEWKP